MSGKLKNGECFLVSMGCMFLPRKMSGTMAMKVESITDITDKVFKSILKLRAEFIKENFTTVKIPNGKFSDGDSKKELTDTFKVNVDETFEKMLHPFYRLSEFHEDDTKQIIDLRENRNEFLKIMKFIESQSKYIKYNDEIMQSEHDIKVPQLLRSDFTGVELEDRRILGMYLKPILKF